ncbi:hypothetical protein N8483_02600 [Synechococcus sp. AH-601-O20]|nr:hypothetical protein [Synechococcus sp. AH-601-O20]
MTSDIESIVGSKLYLQFLHRHDKQTQETFNFLVKKAIACLDAIAAQRCKELGDLAYWISLLSLD